MLLSRKIRYRLAALLCAALPPAALTAQTIPNPSFEAESYTVWPGYMSGNVPITGWTTATPGSVGLNPAGGSPFADNGIIPDGTNVAFIQSNGSPTSLSTTISGLTAGQTYQLAFRANARAGQTPRMTVTVDGTQLLNTSVYSVGVGSQYVRIGAVFTALGATATLEISNSTGSDTTVCVDAFAVTPTTTPWVGGAWADDASAGLDSTYFYTHAYNFGSAAGTVIAGVPFTGVAGTNPTVAGKFSTTGLTATFNNDGNNLGGGSRTLANDFLYNGFPASLTLQGLTPGQDYVLTIYSVGWEDPGARFGTFRAGDNVLTADQDAAGNNNGVYISYRYTAPPAGTVTVESIPVQNASIHWYGFANREATLRAAPSITGEPASAVGVIGSTVDLIGGASGTPPLNFQWYKNNVLIPGANSATFSLPVTGTSDAAHYHFTVGNTTGTVTSQKAFVEVYQPLAGVHNSGVDSSNLPLADSEVDPHWTLVENPDNPGIDTVFVHQTSVFPIVAGPWLASSGVSKWIGPRAETSGAAGPADPYVYRTKFDLTGLGTEVLITGGIAVDNLNTAIEVNDVVVPGLTLSNGFGGLTPFQFRSSALPAGTILAGVNNLDIAVVNQGAGYTGLRVENLAVSYVPTGVSPIIVTQPQGGNVTSGSSVTLSARAYGSAPLSYQWQRNGTPLSGETGRTLTISSFALANNGTYTLVVTNPAGSNTTNGAVLTATDVPAFVQTAPAASTTAGTGEDVTLSATGGGSAPLSYQWSFNGQPLPGQTGASLVLAALTRNAAGTYRVTVSNAFGTDTSAPAVLIVKDTIPGLYNSGTDDGRVLLGDGASDLHYEIIVNPDSAPMQAMVQDTTVFPIVGGTWINTSTTGKWIGPRFETSGAAGLAADAGEGGGTYVYRLSFDGTGFNPASMVITGGWATDNIGTGIRVNGVATGLVNNAQFPVLTSFTLDDSNCDFVNGLNTIDFVVTNVDASAGYTGLLVSGLRGLGDMNPPLPPLTVALNGSGQPVLGYSVEPGLTYRVQRSPDMTIGSWTTLHTATPVAAGSGFYTDSAPLPGKAFYRIEVAR